MPRMKKAGSSGPPHPSFFFGCHASESAALRAENLRVQNERLWISSSSCARNPHEKPPSRGDLRIVLRIYDRSAVTLRSE